MPDFGGASAQIVDLRHFRTFRRIADAAAPRTASPTGFAFLDLPHREALPAFMRAGFPPNQGQGDV